MRIHSILTRRLVDSAMPMGGNPPKRSMPANPPWVEMWYLECGGGVSMVEALPAWAGRGTARMYSQYRLSSRRAVPRYGVRSTVWNAGCRAVCHGLCLQYGQRRVRGYSRVSATLRGGFDVTT